MDIKKENLDNIFDNHTPPPVQIEKIEDIRGKAKEFAATIIDNCPDSREKSLALTHVQTAMMWANASIAINEKK